MNDGAPYGVCDRISFQGFGGATRTIRVSYAALAASLRSGFTIQTGTQLFPELSGASLMGTVDPTVTTAVWLPNGRSYQFSYNSYAELARVVLPTGGAYEYDYLGGGDPWAATSGVRTSHVAQCSQAFNCQDILRRVVERRIYPNGGSGSAFSSRDTIGMGASTYSTNGYNYIEVDHVDSSGSIMAAERHYYNGSVGGSIDNLYLNPSTFYESWNTGREVRNEQVAAGGGATLLRRVDNTWAIRQPFSWTSADGYDHNITQTVSTLIDSNQMSKQTFAYDQFNNTADTYEYGYGTGVAAGLVRRRHTDYLVTNAVNGQNYTTTSIHIRRLPSQQQVFDSAGAEKARTTYEYDNYASDANHAPLAARNGISGLDAGYTTGYTTRGNATGVGRWILSSSTPLYSYLQFDVAGNAVKKLDPLSHATTFDFSDRYGSPDGEARSNSAPAQLSGQTSYAFPTLVTNAAGQTVYTQFDYLLGRPVDQEDVNGVVASTSYNDLLDRPSQMIHAANTTAKSQSTFSYDDSNQVISTWSDLTTYGDNALKKATVYDGLGREIQTRLDSDPEGVTYVDTAYDAVGRKATVSNPHRTGSAPTDGVSTYVYDGLSRVTKLIPPDGSNSANNVSTTYSGNCATVTDEAGKSRKSCTDALGRLTGLWEDPSGLNYETDYQYDTLDDLISVTQNGSNSTLARVRTFQYDSLSRLTSAANPESGTITYAYDADGNVITKTAPLPNQTGSLTVTTTNTYDNLNRPTSKTYKDGSVPTLTRPPCSSATTAWASPTAQLPLQATRMAFRLDAGPPCVTAPEEPRGFTTEWAG